MEKEPRIENEKHFEKADLTVVELRADKNFMIRFEV